MVARLLLSLVFDVCESEEDAEGLRALKKVMVPYFLSKSPDRMMSKYAAFTLIDLVVELSSSERTRKRLDLYVATNPSGTMGGGLFKDKFEEHCVRNVKRKLRNTHGGIDDIKLEKEIGGMSVTLDLIEHNKRSLLRGSLGKQHSKDMIGTEVRSQLEENTFAQNPFSRNRATQIEFFDKSRGGPFAGLKEENLVKFIDRKMKEFNRKSR